MAQVYADYMGDADRNDPRAFAAKGDHAGLPPAYVAAAELDPIRDDSLRLAESMAAAGHTHTLKVYPGVMHTFFVVFNAVIGVLFLPRANRELFGTQGATAATP